MKPIIENQLDLIGEEWTAQEQIKLYSGETVTFNNFLVTEPDQLYELLEDLPKAFVYDSETSGLRPRMGDRICGHAITMKTAPLELANYYIPVRHEDINATQLDPDFVAKALVEYFTTDKIFFGHHLKYDVGMLRADGVDIRDCEWHDVSTMALLHNENEYSFKLKYLADKKLYKGARAEEENLANWRRKDARKLKLAYQQRKTTHEDPIGSPTYLERYGFSRTPVNQCGLYACHDGAFTLLLVEYYIPLIFPQFQRVYDREMAVSKILHEMEWNGVDINADEIHRVSGVAKKELDRCLLEIRTIVEDPEFVITDGTLRVLFYDKFKMKAPKETDGKQKSVDKESRKILENQYPQHAELFNALNSWANANKTYTTYGAGFLRGVTPEGKVHPSYNQLERREKGGIPVTGRLSSQDPNFQNITKKPIKLPNGEEFFVRVYFTVPEGYILVYIDLSQIELRVLAWLSKDPELLRCYANDLDVHQMTADDVTGGDRGIAKQVNFGNNYGMTKIGLAKRLPYYHSDPGKAEDDAEVYLRKYFQKYKGIPKYRDSLTRFMQQHNNSFVNYFGRPRRIEEISSSKQWERERAQRRMMSSMVSGTSADMLKEIMIRCKPVLRPQDEFRGTIHDEVVFLLAIEGCGEILTKLMHEFTDWPDFADVNIGASCEVTTTTWQDKRELLVYPDGTFAWPEK
jgi:DNA polymerase-1